MRKIGQSFIEGAPGLEIKQKAAEIVDLLQESGRPEGIVQIEYFTHGGDDYVQVHFSGPAVARKRHGGAESPRQSAP